MRERDEIELAYLGSLMCLSLLYDISDGCSELMSFTLILVGSFSFMSKSSKLYSSSDGRDRPNLKVAELVPGKPCT